MIANHASRRINHTAPPASNRSCPRLELAWHNAASDTSALASCACLVPTHATVVAARIFAMSAVLEAIYSTGAALDSAQSLISLNFPPKVVSNVAPTASTALIPLSARSARPGIIRIKVPADCSVLTIFKPLTWSVSL